MYDAKVLQAYRIRKNVDIGAAQLEECQLIGIVVIVGDKAFDVGQRLHAYLVQHAQERLVRRRMQLSLGDGGYLLVELVEGTQVEIAAEGIDVKRHPGQLSLLHRRNSWSASSSLPARRLRSRWYSRGVSMSDL